MGQQELVVMEDKVICPVCGKTGIPDYHKEDIVCPQCGSDLSIYRVIDQIPTKRGINIWKPISATAIIAAAVMGFFLETKNPKPTVDDTSRNYAVLKDSVDILTKEVAELKAFQKTQSEFSYIVRKGDSFWTISRKFYGTGSRCKEIAENNNLQISADLEVGDTLIIR